MEITHLKYFLTLAKYKHFTQAADELCISQSSLSKHIKALENELGTQLIDRSTRNLRLTAFGEEFYQFCSKVLEDYSEMNLKLKEHLAQEKQYIKIGAVPVMNQHGITTLIAAFQKNFPNMHVEIIQRKTKELITLLKNGELDVAFFVSDSVTTYDFDTYPIMYDELVLITNKRHPLTAHKYLTFSQISNEDFVFFDPASGIHEISVASCRQAGFEPNIVHVCTQIDTMLELVAEGLGVSLLMEKTVSYFNNPRIRILHFKNPIMGSTVLAVPKSKKHSLSVSTFKNFTIDWINSNSKN
jgi:LysR family transcriptional activator of glutamate synthase operon